MKSFLLSLILIGYTSWALSQTPSEPPKVQKVELPMICLKPADAEKLLNQSKESVVFAGLDTAHGVENLTINLFYNEEKTTYTLMFVTLDKDLVCLLSAGEKAKFLLK